MYDEKEIKIKKRKISNKKEKKYKRTKINKSNYSKTKRKKFTIPPILTKINWYQLIFKLLTLVIVMMLIIFTISRIKKHNDKQKAIFKNNVEIIENACLTYFNNNTLPINIGDSTSFVLEEMKNLELINEIKDNEDKFCDYLDSYIILTKTSSQEYRLKIYLKCSNKEKKVEEKIICKEKCFIQK